MPEFLEAGEGGLDQPLTPHGRLRPVKFRLDFALQGVHDAGQRNLSVVQ